MLRYILNILLFFLLLIFASPVYANDFSKQVIENYTLKISRKFSNTYCNTTKFGISKEGALNFAIGETNKEFLNNKLNKFIDYDLLKDNVLLMIRKNCQVYDFPVRELENLVLKN